MQSGYKNPNWKGGIQSLDKDYGKKQALKYYRKRRMLCLQFYSGEIPQCNCCGEKLIQFLCIDHINGGGNKHRKELKSSSGYALYSWLIKNDFPKGFQVLCHNCNMAKGFYGECPHKKLFTS